MLARFDAGALFGDGLVPFLAVGLAVLDRGFGEALLVGRDMDCFEIFTSIPAAAIVMTKEDPPKEMNGKGIPVTGRTSRTAPMLIIASAPIQVIKPTARYAEKRSGASRAARSPLLIKKPKMHSTAIIPTRPSSSPITDAMKSV